MGSTGATLLCGSCEAVIPNVLSSSIASLHIQHKPVAVVCLGHAAVPNYEGTHGILPKYLVLPLHI